MPTLTDAEQALIVHLEDHPDALYLAGLRAGMERAAKICDAKFDGNMTWLGAGQAIRDAIPTAASPE